MRSARMLLATAAATGAIAIATPGVAFAAFGGDDGGRDDSSYSRSRDSGGDQEKGGSGRDQEKDYGKEGGDEHGRGEPRGGMHTGGGALASVPRSGNWGSGSDSDSGGDSRFDPESYKGGGDDGGGKGGKGGDDGGGKGGKGGDDGGGRGGKGGDDGGGKGGWGDDEEKPRGGMHTGGGALATPGVTAGGLAVLAVGATGMYALRRKKATAPAS
ncbi:hypothetical protein [Streptomyces sp. NPDC096012]|uniref:hypothetical protein n=1 Tax=Streptomyces sp. NPDC096012 TaxID=3155684 RepID=UPI00336A627E